MERLVNQSTVTLYKLKEDVKNPNYDGRRRHGLEARKVFKAGTKLVVTRVPLVWDMDGKQVSAGNETQVTVDGSWVFRTEMRDALMAHIQETTEQTWEDVYNMENYGLTEGEIIQAMLDKGLVTLDSLKALMEQNAKG